MPNKPRVTAVAALLVVALLPAAGHGAEGGGKVVATVNVHPITATEIDQRLESLPPQVRGQFATGERRQQLVEQVILGYLMSEAATKEGLDREKEFKEGMAQAKEALLARLYMKKHVAEEGQPSDEELKKEYDRLLPQLSPPPQIHARHILVKTEKEALAARKRVVEGKEPFEAVAKAVSTDPSAAEGGDLGVFGQGRMVPAFEKAAFALKEGEVSEPVQTQFGWHVIKVEEKKENTPPPSFDEVKPRLAQQVIQDRYRTQLKTLADTLKAKARIEFKEEGADKKEGGAKQEGAAKKEGAATK